MAADGEVLALLKDGQEVESASPGEKVELVLPATPFYVEAGGQVSDTGVVSGRNESPWEVRIETVRKPVEGLILHVGEVVEGNPRIGDPARAALDTERRLDIMRNHTATHLLHAALREVLGHHVRQAGSLVAPDRLRFDFTHPEAVTREQLDRIEAWVNHAILANYPLRIEHEPREQAVAEGAMALFGETYGDVVRTVRIGDERTLSFELCGGTHVPETGIIGPPTFSARLRKRSRSGFRPSWRSDSVLRSSYKLRRSRQPLRLSRGSSRSRLRTSQFSSAISTARIPRSCGSSPIDSALAIENGP